ncbi:MAG TPA: hypothetical protein ACQGQG_00120 [Xylella sp.]
MIVHVVVWLRTVASQEVLPMLGCSSGVLMTYVPLRFTVLSGCTL